MCLTQHALPDGGVANAKEARSSPGQSARPRIPAVAAAPSLTQSRSRSFLLSPLHLHRRCHFWSTPASSSFAWKHSLYLLELHVSRRAFVRRLALLFLSTRFLPNPVGGAAESTRIPSKLPTHQTKRPQTRPHLRPDAPASLHLSHARSVPGRHYIIESTSTSASTYAHPRPICALVSSYTALETRP